MKNGKLCLSAFHPEAIIIKLSSGTQKQLFLYTIASFAFLLQVHLSSYSCRRESCSTHQQPPPPPKRKKRTTYFQAGPCLICMFRSTMKKWMKKKEEKSSWYKGERRKLEYFVCQPTFSYNVALSSFLSPILPLAVTKFPLIKSFVRNEQRFFPLCSSHFSSTTVFFFYCCGLNGEWICTARLDFQNNFSGNWEDEEEEWTREKETFLMQQWCNWQLVREGKWRLSSFTGYAPLLVQETFTDK